MAKNEKICPLLNQDCLKTKCALYNEKFHRCDIAVLVYNLYRFSQSVEHFSDVMSSDSKDGENGIKDFLKC